MKIPCKGTFILVCGRHVELGRVALVCSGVHTVLTGSMLVWDMANSVWGLAERGHNVPSVGLTRGLNSGAGQVSAMGRTGVVCRWQWAASLCAVLGVLLAPRAFIFLLLVHSSSSCMCASAQSACPADTGDKGLEGWHGEGAASGRAGWL